MTIEEKRLALARLGIGSFPSASTATTTVTIVGTKGDQGDSGTAGKDGKDGADGADGVFDPSNFNPLFQAAVSGMFSAVDGDRDSDDDTLDFNSDDYTTVYDAGV